MRSATLPFLLLATLTASFAQQRFARAYGLSDGIDDAYNPVLLGDGGIMLAGSTNGSIVAGDYDAYVVRTDDAGELLWARSYGAEARDIGEHLARMTDGTVVLTGNTNSWDATGPKPFLLKLDAAGDVAWSRTYGDSSDMSALGRWVEPTNDGGLIFTGEGDASGISGWAAFVVRTNDQGDTLWSNWYQAGSLSRVSCVRALSDGRFLIIANNKALCISANGDMMWSRTTGGMSGLYTAAPLPDGGAYIVGVCIGASDNGLAVLRINSAGDTLWTRRYTSIGPQHLAVLATDDGGFTVTGDGSGNPLRGFILHGDANGELVWAKRIPGSEYDQFRGICQAANGDPVIGGYYATSTTFNECLLIRSSDDAYGCYASAFAPLTTSYDCGWSPTVATAVRRSFNVRQRTFQVGEGGVRTDLCVGSGVGEGPSVNERWGYHDAHTGQLVVDLPAAYGWLELYTACGERVMDRRIPGMQPARVPLAELPPGLYLAVLSTEKGEQVLKLTIGY